MVNWLNSNCTLSKYSNTIIVITHMCVHHPIPFVSRAIYRVAHTLLDSIEIDCAIDIAQQVLLLLYTKYIKKYCTLNNSQVALQNVLWIRNLFYLEILNWNTDFEGKRVTVTHFDSNYYLAFWINFFSNMEI